MSLKKKPNKEGLTRNYITRTQAIRKLQVSLKDFQRLCILKGVYPRDVARGNTLTSKGINRRKLKKDKIYYHVNDIRYLGSGDLLNKFRDISIHLKKFKKLVARGELFDAKLLIKNKPKYSLVPIIKQRCPTLVSAIANLDDALSTIATVSALPTDFKRGMKANLIKKCNIHLNHFLKYISDKQLINKTFISIKGFYFQAKILNETVTWIIPHAFPQNLPEEVDFKVIMTFVEYYLELLKLVNYKLYEMSGMVYPPVNNSPNSGDEFYHYSPSNTSTSGKLFSNFVFYISNEVPQVPTALVLLSAGATITHIPNKATHYIVDKPINGKFMIHQCTNVTIPLLVLVSTLLPPEERLENVEYVQPQYVFDCLNCNLLLPIEQYAPGVKLPNHLSPFVNPDDVYVPERQKELEQLIIESNAKILGTDAKPTSEDKSTELPVPTEYRDMQTSLMSKKHKRLLSKIEFAKQRRDARAKELESRRKSLKSPT